MFYPLLYQAEKARRKGSVNAVPLTPTQTSLVPVAAEAFLENIEVCVMDDPGPIASSFELYIINTSVFLLSTSLCCGGEGIAPKDTSRREVAECCEISIPSAITPRASRPLNETLENNERDLDLIGDGALREPTVRQ